MIPTKEKARSKWNSLKQRADNKGIPFDLSVRDVRMYMKIPRCEVTNHRFTETGTHRQSFDRIIPEKGYTKGNIVVCTQRINTAKSNMSINELKQLYRKYCDE